jgi:hypothetical protein
MFPSRHNDQPLNLDEHQSGRDFTSPILYATLNRSEEGRRVGFPETYQKTLPVPIRFAQARVAGPHL